MPTKKAQQVVKALRRDPLLLFHVLAGLHTAEVKLAGPWTRATMSYRERRDPTGKLLTRVMHEPNKPLPWRAATAKDLNPFTPPDATGGQPRERAFPSEGDAIGWCETTLAQAQFTLV